MDTKIRKVNENWLEYECSCGIGDPHSYFSRSDLARVGPDHGQYADRVMKTLFCSGPYVESGWSSKMTCPEKAMKVIDKRYPL